MGFLLGVDGGGTKTAFILYSLESGEIKRIITGSICPNDHGIDKFKSIVSNAACELTENACNDIEAVCLGIPCYGEVPKLDEQTRLAARTIFNKTDAICVNDCVVGFAGALGLEQGINIVAGTGAIAYGENALGRGARSSGWSGDFSDEGSCCWLGKKCLELFCKQADGRLPKMSLYQILNKELGLRDDLDIIVYYDQNLKGSRRELASMQKYLFMAAKDGDTSALAAYELAASELACSIEAVRKAVELEGSVPVSYAGGLFNTGEMILKPLTEKLRAVYNGYVLQTPRFSPEEGALLMAAASIGVDKNRIINKLAGK